MIMSQELIPTLQHSSNITTLKSQYMVQLLHSLSRLFGCAAAAAVHLRLRNDEASSGEVDEDTTDLCRAAR